MGFANTLLESQENNAMFASSTTFETKTKRVFALQGVKANACMAPVSSNVNTTKFHAAPAQY